MHPASTVALALIPALALTACGPGNFLNDNDRLRAENLALSRDVQALETKLQQRLQQIEALNHRVAHAHTPPDVDPPIPSGIEIDRYSGPADTTRDGHHDILRLYLLPVDQHGRMIPVAGTLTVALVHLPDEGQPTVLETRVLPPEQLDDAYRDGFTGPYYAVNFDLTELTLPAPPTDRLTVRVLLDAATAGPLRAQADYRVTLAAGNRE